MKRLLFTLVAACSFSTLSADIELSAHYNNINDATFKKSSSQRHHKLSFAEGYLLGTYTHKVDDKVDLDFGVGYMDTKFSFSHHPKNTSFHQQHVHNLLLDAAVETRKEENWVWSAGLGLQINTDNFSLSRYTFFNGSVHGKYKYTKKSHLHVGMLAYTGMRYSRALPIIGFDYTFNKKWKLNAVFPEDIALIYSINDHWSLDAGIRYFLTRQRLDSKKLVAYRNWGAEAGVKYACNDRIKLKLHVGDTFGGRMRISNHHDKHRKHLTLGSALYYGFEASFAF